MDEIRVKRRATARLVGLAVEWPAGNGWLGFGDALSRALLRTGFCRIARLGAGEPRSLFSRDNGSPGNGAQVRKIFFSRGSAAGRGEVAEPGPREHQRAASDYERSCGEPPEIVPDKEEDTKVAADEGDDAQNYIDEKRGDTYLLHRRRARLTNWPPEPERVHPGIELAKSRLRRWYRQQ